MTTEALLEQELQRYLAHQVSLDDLFRWLARHVQAIADLHDKAASDLEAEVWIRIDDVDEGAASEDEFRDWLNGDRGRD